MGEPLANHNRVLAAVHRICDPAPDGLGTSQRSVTKPVEEEFVRRVNTAGVACTVRDTRGREIAAACGQLAAEG